MYEEDCIEEAEDGFIDAIPAFFCKVANDYCIFNTEDWKPGLHFCKVASTHILVEEK
jgi:hypothetical protein